MSIIIFTFFNLIKIQGDLFFMAKGIVKDKVVSVILIQENKRVLQVISTGRYNWCAVSLMNYHCYEN